MILLIYNRGVDKRKIFFSEADYKRFKYLLYLCNSNAGVKMYDVLKSVSKSPFEFEKKNELVKVVAWCLMPNHFHLLISTNDISKLGKFMQKVTTGYTMYFNKKNERTGALLSGTYKSKYVESDEYYERVLNYIHMNPLELFPGNKGDMLENYLHSSLIDYLKKVDREEVKILDLSDVSECKNKTLKEVLNFSRLNLEINEFEE